MEDTVGGEVADGGEEIVRRSGNLDHPVVKSASFLTSQAQF